MRGCGRWRWSRLGLEDGQHVLGRRMQVLIDRQVRHLNDGQRSDETHSGEQDRERHRRATVDAHVAVRQYLGVRVVRDGLQGEGDPVVKPGVGHLLADVVLPVPQVPHVGRVGGYKLFVRAFESVVDDVSDADLLDLVQVGEHCGLADVEGKVSPGPDVFTHLADVGHRVLPSSGGCCIEWGAGPSSSLTSPAQCT